MAIILAGGGDPHQSLAVDLWFRTSLHQLASQRRTVDVAFVADAIAPKEWSFQRAERWLQDRDAMEGLSIKTIRQVPKNAPKLRSALSVFLMGGNTFRLLRTLHSPHVAAAVKYMAKRGLVYGCSAGAVVFGHSIKSALIGKEADKNEIGLQDLRGLNLLCGANVLTHFTPEDRQAAERLTNEEGRPCICIPEESGCVWNAGRLKNVGEATIELVFPGPHWISLPVGGEIGMRARVSTQ
jgi:peptidase E